MFLPIFINVIHNRAEMASVMMGIIKKYKRYKRCDARCSMLDSSVSQYRASRIKHRASRWGQSITEYTVFITVVVMALLAMQIYFKRGVQGKIKDMVGYLGSESYNPNSTYSEFSTDTSVVYETTFEDGIRTTQTLLDQTNRTGEEIVLPETVN